ncbi:glycosyltransferase family 1 protein [Fictibacillus sp. NRS-1165]|uniref:glycosyltransferase family 1 protein n=1 Tax=Fictibacillus sp. NRS-1165 TaxID=3144463 RepID=UPI003D1D662F
MIRILHITGGMNRGGQETFIMNVYRNIDRSKIQFDFVVHSNSKYDYEEEINKLGGKLHRLPPKKKNPLKYFSEIKKLVTVNNYSIVHRHTCNASSFLELYAAKQGGAQILIAHSHNTNDTSNIVLHNISKVFLNKLVDYKYACSTAAGKWLFGTSNFEVINNGVDTDLYKYNESIKNKILKAEKINSSFVIGHVGRFSKVKNHNFLLDIFQHVIKKEKDSKLLLIGVGEEQEGIKEKVNKLDLNDNVLFLGKRDNVNELLQSIDVFVYPSLFEGLPVSLIEAQASGLPCVISDNITNEVAITNLVTSFSLNENAANWANIILRYKNFNRDDTSDQIKNSGYDIKTTTLRLQSIYIK